MSMVEVRHRASEALQKPSMHETAGHKSRLWIFDQVSSGAAESRQAMTITATPDNQIRKSKIRNWTIGLQTFATGSLPRSGLVQRNVMEYRASTPISRFSRPKT